MIEPKSKFSVSELSSEIKRSLEGLFFTVKVYGEVSNLHIHSSGHIYFTLKDKNAELRCVMFKNANQFLGFDPEDGLNISAIGRVSFYKQRGTLQLIIDSMKPDGIGDLFKAFEALKSKLAKEGLFREEFKKIIPPLPKRIGIITSRTGSVIKDITETLKRRAPHIHLILRSAIVQGDKAADDIIRAIKDLEKFGKIDSIILGRGGGSLEDLWPFNDELVARAIFNCKIPIISAVGHETDFTISDLVSDCRASTPSVAAELVTQSSKEISSKLLLYLNNLERRYYNNMQIRWQSVDLIEGRILFNDPQMQIKKTFNDLSIIYEKIFYSMNQYLTKINLEKNNYKNLLFSLDPKRVLKRGYSIAIKNNGAVIKRADEISFGESFKLQTGNGSFNAEKITDSKNKEIT
tara:strand:- start:114818 stop:116035 length:1218 start_codon:yes stop_codon:yes gene_type:complete